MKVVMVGNFGLWHKGTMGVRALPMAKALVERGHRVTLVVPPWDSPDDSGQEYVLDGVAIANVKLPPRLPLLFHAPMTLRLFRRALAEKADVVHIFKPKAYSGLVAMVLWLLKRFGLSKSRLVLDADDWEGWGGWNELESFPWIVKWFIAWHERWGLRHNDTVTVASRELESIVHGLGVPAHRIHYVPNGCWQPSVTSGSRPPAPVPCPPSPPPHPPSPPTVLLYTRFFEYPLSRVVEVFSRVKDAVPEAKLLVVGEGLHGEENELQQLLRVAELERDATFAGWVRPEELPAYFALAGVAIYPMDDTLLNRAKCPMKLVDLMVGGLPVVAERVGQTAEYIRDGESGVLVPPNRPAEFAEAVVGLLNDPARGEALGARARQRVLQTFDWRNLVESVESAYAPDRDRRLAPKQRGEGTAKRGLD